MGLGLWLFEKKDRCRKHGPVDLFNKLKLWLHIQMAMEQSFQVSGFLLIVLDVAFSNIAVCCSTLLGAPAFAPIGTNGATARGVPV